MEPYTTKDGIVISDHWLNKLKDSIREQREMNEFKARTCEPNFYKKLLEDLAEINRVKRVYEKSIEK